MSKTIPSTSLGPQLLRDAKPALEQYLKEAKYCASCKYEGTKVLGLAAMSLALSVIITLGEILIDDDLIKMGKSVRIYISDNDCIKRIDPELEKNLPVNEWYFFDPAVGKAIPDDLCGIRNSLVHAASLPDGFMLIPDKSHFSTSLFHKNPKIIAITQFITAIENTLNDIDENLHFTPASKYSDRSIINIINLTTTSGSSGGS